MPHKYIVLNRTTINQFLQSGLMSTNTAYKIKITMSDCDPNQLGIITGDSEFDYLSTWVKFN